MTVNDRHATDRGRRRRHQAQRARRAPCRPAARELRRDRDRRRPGRALGRLSPRARRRALRDPRCARAHRRCLAQALGLAAPVHAGEVRRPAGHALPRPAQLLPDQGRDGGLPRGVCAGASRCRCAPACGSSGCSSAARATWSRRARASSRPRRWWWRWRSTSRAEVPAFAACALRRDRAAALAGLPQPGAAAPGGRAARGRRQLRRRHRAGSGARRSRDLACRAAIPARCRSGPRASSAAICSRRLVLRLVFHRLLTVNTPLGRKARPAVLANGAPLIRVKRADLRAGGRAARGARRRACATVGRCSRTGARSRSPTSSGAAASSRASSGSSCRCSMPTAQPRHTERRRRGAAGALLRRPAVPARDVLVDDPRRGPGCGAHRPRDPAQPRLPAQGCGAGGSGFLNRSTT